MEKGRQEGIPSIIAEQTIAKSEQEQHYLDIVRLCHALGEWYPEATTEQCDGRTENPVRRPTQEHPVLVEERYRRERMLDAPLNVRGRKKLKRMQRQYDHKTTSLAKYQESEILYGTEPRIYEAWLEREQGR
jgi:hypothetical protein